MFDDVEMRVESIDEEEGIIYLVELDEDEVIIDGDELLEMIADEISAAACAYHIAQEVVTNRLRQHYKGKSIIYTESSLNSRQEMVDYLNELRGEDMEEDNVESPFLTEEPFTLADL